MVYGELMQMGRFFNGSEGFLLWNVVINTIIYDLYLQNLRLKQYVTKYLLNFDRFFAGTNLERAGTEGFFAGTNRKQSGFLRKNREQKGYIWNKCSRFGILQVNSLSQYILILLK